MDDMHTFVNPDTGKIEFLPMHWGLLAIAGTAYVVVAIGLLMFAGSPT